MLIICLVEKDVLAVSAFSGELLYDALGADAMLSTQLFPELEPNWGRGKRPKSARALRPEDPSSEAITFKKVTQDAWKLSQPRTEEAGLVWIIMRNRGFTSMGNNLRKKK